MEQMLKLLLSINTAHLIIIVPSGQMQGSRVSALLVPAIDVVWRAELLDTGQAAFLGRVQKRYVTTQQILKK